MKQKICAAVLSAAMLICAYGTAVFASTDNIALNAQCTTNSQNGQHVAGRAVDGNLVPDGRRFGKKPHRG